MNKKTPLLTVPWSQRRTSPRHHFGAYKYTVETSPSAAEPVHVSWEPDYISWSIPSSWATREFYGAIMLARQGSTRKIIWIWPRGLYPGQLPFYLKAKSLPLSALNTTDNPNGLLTIVPIRVDPAITRLAPALPNTEPQPPDSLLPVMQIFDGDTARILHQSTAIVQYLEECYPPSQGYRDLSGGSNPELKAHVRAIVQLVTDAMIWMQGDIFHAHEFAVTLGQITKEEQSAAASMYAKQRWRKELAKLNRWVEEHDQEKEPISLAGALNTPTIADFTLLSAVELFKDFFNVDILEGFAALEVWYKRYTESPWWVRREDVDALGESRFVDLFRG